MDSGEVTPRRKNKKKPSKTPQEEFTPFILKIVLTNETNLPTQKDYFFANNFTLKQHEILIGQPVLLMPIDKPIDQSFPIVCHPWPVATINRNCVSLLKSRLQTMGSVEGDLVRVLKIDSRIPNAVSVKFRSFSETTNLLDKEAISYIATQLNGKYVFYGSRCQVSYKSMDTTLEVSAVKGLNAENIKEQFTQSSLFNISHISPLIDSDTVQLTPPIDADTEQLTPPIDADTVQLTPPIDADTVQLTPPIDADTVQLTPPIDADTVQLTPPIDADTVQLTPPIDADTVQLTPPIDADTVQLTPPIDADTVQLTPPIDDNYKLNVYIISNKTVLNMEQSNKLGSTIKELNIKLKDLAGIEKQAREIQAIIDVFIATEEAHRNFRMNIPSGILVCGNVGVGKTTLLKSLETHFAKKTTVKFIQTEILIANNDLLRDLTTLTNYRNAVVLLDDIDSLHTQKDYVTGTNSLVSSICQLLDYLQREGGVLVATCTHRDEVDRNLKRPGRLEKEIDLVSPNSEERLRILQSILELTPSSVSVPDLSELSWRAHGYVAGDLRLVVREGTLNMLKRLGNNLNEAKLEIQDLQEGLKKVRPSAMRDVILEVPRVKWNDIGGMQDIIQKIRETVEWPLQHPEAFTRLGLRPPKGILLYGPPGCSKTMIARAIATESGLNFLAVKGPEIFSKWVGDSEKAVRDIFMKAKMAAPAIIFFDEIDALAVEREGQGSRVADRVLTQLLTEMDGLERLEGVTVVAATNRPDLMDTALLRPGRMDRLIYIPIPNAVTRKEIFRIKLSKMSCEPNLSFDWLIGMSDGFSGAEIVNVCEEAAMICLQENIQNEFIQQKHLEKAAKSLKPQITKEMNEFYETFSKNNFLKKI